MLTLPENYEDKMQKLLEGEYRLYCDTFFSAPAAGLRVNTGKITPGELSEKLPFSLRPVPWISNGFYYKKEDMPSRHPYYYAGLYYLQEPSAMTPASRLPVEPGDKVLDLCAAPGGKATELGARLKGEGVLFANDISNSRAKGLLKNLERMGISNIYVTSEEPGRLAEVFPAYFDKILLDAPCSGEGMFRREPSMISYWEEKGPSFYSPLQRQLLVKACHMLKPGGLLLYSTCTFSEEENEENIAWLLEEYSFMRLIPMEGYGGFVPGRAVNEKDLSHAVRIYPHKMEGEGHFMALLKKEEDSGVFFKPTEQDILPCMNFAEIPEECQDFLRPVSRLFAGKRFYLHRSFLYYLPQEEPMPRKLRYLRTGLFLGEWKKNRFEPSQALAMYLTAQQYPFCIHLSSQDIRTIKYLKGETITVSPEECPSEEGWQLLCTDGYPLGWGKRSKTTVKNKYAPGWRYQ